MDAGANQRKRLDGQHVYEDSGWLEACATPTVVQSQVKRWDAHVCLNVALLSQVPMTYHTTSG